MSIRQPRMHAGAHAHVDEQEHDHPDTRALARHASVLTPLVTPSILAAVLLLGGCGSDDAGDGGATGTGGSGAQGGGGAGGGTPAECVPSEAQGPVDDSCGIFVAPSGNDDTGLGTKLSPYATIGKGLEKATDKPIYLCADAFTETVVIAKSVDIFGGLDCAANWTWVGQTTKTALTSTAGAIPLSVAAAGSGSHITDVAITAAAGTQGTGESSVAALVDQAQVLFERCELTAQAGADGALGDTPPGRGQDGVKGPDGVVGCQGTALVIPLNAATVSCTTGGTSTGGLGGVGTVNTNGGAGSDGESNPAVSSPAVNGGAGQTISAQPGNGTQGADGAPGAPGAGATGIGTIDSTAGYVGVPGQDGQGNGSPAQGGGAGGGARGSVACSNGSFAGPAGTGGGTGGCGGLPGSAGGPGGSSIALISLNATVTLAACTFTAANGGTGGQGSPGQEGGNGLGGGALGTGNNNNSGAGGGGGKGGQGGAAGGGHGGHSLGIAFDGGTAPVLTDTTFSLGTLGVGGPGGISPALDGEAGQSCQSLDFASGSCTNG